MINLGQNGSNRPRAFTEGLLGDTFKDLSIDTDKVKSDWEDAESVSDYMKTANDDVIQPLKNKTDEIEDHMKKKGHIVDNRSIIARARNSILQFPVYISQSSRVNEAHIYSQMFERVYATMIQAVLAQNPIMDEKEANNLIFLKQYHTNIKEAADIIINEFYEPIDEFDQMMKESIFFSQQLTENCRVEFKAVPPTNRDLLLENTRLMNEPLTGFIYLKESDDKDDKKDTITEEEKTENRQVKNVRLSEDDIRNLAANEINLTSDERRLLDQSDSDIRREMEERKSNSKPKPPQRGASEDERREHAEACDKWTREVSKAINSKIDKKRDIEKRVDEKTKVIKGKIKSGKFPGYAYRNGSYMRSDVTDTTSTKTHTSPRPTKTDLGVDAPKLLRDNEVKKVNGMAPFMMEVSFHLTNTKSGDDRIVRYIIGIKSVLHLIRVQDLAEDLNELVTGNIRKLQKVRYKTGEITFKDYFLNIKGIKKDAAKNINYNKKWINTLKRLAEYSKTYGSLLNKPASLISGGNVPIPNATLILTQPDVTMLTNQTGIDLSQVSNAKRLARSLFLIAIVITDSSAGTMRVLFPDRDDDWEVQSLSSVETEISKTDNNNLMKELNRMVNK